MKALKSGGIIYWNFTGDGNCSNLFDTIKIMMNDNRYKEFFLDFDWPWFMPTKDEYEGLMGNFAFSEIIVNDENADRYFMNVEEMIKWLDQPSLVPFMKHIPDNKKEYFRQDVIEMMIDKTRQADGRCFETFRRIKVQGKK